MSSDDSGSDDDGPADAVMQIEASEELELPNEEQSFFAHGSSQEEEGAWEEAGKVDPQGAAGPSSQNRARQVGR